MHTIPVTILDNFFEDPDAIREWALTLPYFSDPEGKWPGLRTAGLHEMNTDFVDYLARKYFALFFDFEYEKCTWTFDAVFQKVDKHYGQGWVHDDSGRRTTGIIYLNPNPNPGSGTSLYKKKKEHVFPDNRVECNLAKKAFYTNHATIDQVSMHKKRLDDSYYETLRVNNVYNRLFTFDSYLHHSANEFVGESIEDDEVRLTLVFFAGDLYCNRTPVMRSRVIV
jgi:hypothetical protein